jgi:hypothetical protein
MRNKVGRVAGLAGLAAGMLALVSGAGAPALAATTDAGTLSVSINHTTLTGLAKAGIVALPAGGTATYRNSRENLTLPVSGGDGSFLDSSGSLDLSGSFQLIDGLTGKSVTLGTLIFSYGTGLISAKGGAHRVAIGQVGGTLNGTSTAGPPATQSFSASAVTLTSAGARYLNSALHTRYFKAGGDIGGLVTTYDLTTS